MAQSPQKTWNKDTCCLWSSSQMVAPDPTEKMILAANSLGVKRLHFMHSAHISGVVLGAYPKLCGIGLDFLRPAPAASKPRGKLMLIKEPKEGYAVPSLRDIIGQSKLYIRPRYAIDVTEVTLDCYN